MVGFRGTLMIGYLEADWCFEVNCTESRLDQVDFFGLHFVSPVLEVTFELQRFVHDLNNGPVV
jgi:hypothetical protein